MSKLLHFILFADDTNILKYGDDLQTLCKEISEELNKLHTWFDVNKLSLNVQKTNFIVFGRRQNNTDSLTIRGKNIEQVYSTKFLGVIIDANLSWKPQISYIRNKLAKCTAIFYKSKDLINFEALMLLYNTLFLPYLSYCAEMWANTYKTRLHVLLVLQKRVVRIIANVTKYAHTNELFKRFRILKLHELIEYKTGILMYNVYHDKIPSNLKPMFTIGTTIHYQTRQKNKFKILFRNTNIKAFCVTSIGAKLWNSLPIELADAKSLHTFKFKFKLYLLDRY